MRPLAFDEQERAAEEQSRARENENPDEERRVGSKGAHARRRRIRAWLVQKLGMAVMMRAHRSRAGLRVGARDDCQRAVIERWHEACGRKQAHGHQQRKQHCVD